MPLRRRAEGSPWGIRRVLQKAGEVLVGIGPYDALFLGFHAAHVRDGWGLWRRSGRDVAGQGNEGLDAGTEELEGG